MMSKALFRIVLINSYNFVEDTKIDYKIIYVLAKTLDTCFQTGA